MTCSRSLISILEEMSILNRVHMGLEKVPSMTRSYEKGRYAQLVKLLEEKRGVQS